MTAVDQRADQRAERSLVRHLEEHRAAVDSVRDQLPLLRRWGQHLAQVLPAGGRLLAGGNGGSAAQAQHLTAEIVGRYHHERQPLSAIALHTEPVVLSAICNDYGVEEVFARQVLAHGRDGDVCLLFSTSGRSRNLIEAAKRGRDAGITTWAATGPRPNPLADACEEALVVDASSTAAVQEVHLVALHLLCAELDTALGVTA